MLIKKGVLVVTAALVLSASPAWADSIDFTLNGSGGTWSWAGSIDSTLTAVSKSTDVQVSGSPTKTHIHGHSTTQYTSGGFSSGSGTPGSPYVFGPGAPN